jgi:SAM-dependent methyltransferase
MDLRSRESGLTKDYFWYRCKLGLIELLFSKVCTDKEEPKKRKILNVGIGTGDDLSMMQEYGSVFAIDTNADAINTLPHGLYKEKKVCSICAIDYQDDYFDIVVVFDVLGLIENDALAVREIRRVLKPKGICLFTVPALSFLYSAHDRYYGHHRRYDMNSIKKIFSCMDCEAIGYWMFLPFFPIALKKIIHKKGSKMVYASLPGLINTILYSICRFETYLIKKGFCMPIGTTIYGIYEK